MIKDMLENKRTVSFEIFPPKKDGEFKAVFEVLDALGRLSPDFVSVTYGAGGSRSGKTIEIASYIQNTLGIDAIAHMLPDWKQQILLYRQRFFAVRDSIWSGDDDDLPCFIQLDWNKGEKTEAVGAFVDPAFCRNPWNV